MNDRFYPRRFMALLVKESLQILRDPSTMLIAFVLPLLLLLEHVEHGGDNDGER